jgi:hypothetical protein
MEIKICFWTTYMNLYNLYKLDIKKIQEKCTSILSYRVKFKIWGYLTLAAYVSKDGLVGHHWKERPIGRANFICRGMPGPRSGNGWVGEWVREHVGDFGIALKM